jgi:hypothetical protein
LNCQRTVSELSGFKKPIIGGGFRTVSELSESCQPVLQRLLELYLKKQLCRSHFLNPFSRKIELSIELSKQGF